MEILKTKTTSYTLKASNYHKPTPLYLKVVADVLVGSILVIDPILQTQLPEFEGKAWVIIGWNIFVALFKLTSKAIADAKAQAV